MPKSIKALRDEYQDVVSRSVELRRVAQLACEVQYRSADKPYWEAVSEAVDALYDAATAARNEGYLAQELAEAWHKNLEDHGFPDESPKIDEGEDDTYWEHEFDCFDTDYVDQR